MCATCGCGYATYDIETGAPGKEAPQQ